MNFQDEYSRLRDRIEEYLRNAIPEDVPQPLGDAMRYSLLAGGKRLRAVLLLAAYSLLKDDIETALPFAAAVTVKRISDFFESAGFVFGTLMAFLVYIAL